MAVLKNILQKSLMLIIDPWQWKSHGWGIGFIFALPELTISVIASTRRRGEKQSVKRDMVAKYQVPSSGYWANCLLSTLGHGGKLWEEVRTGRHFSAGRAGAELGHSRGTTGAQPGQQPRCHRVPGPIQRGCPCYPCWALTITHPNCPLAFSCIWELLCNPFSWHAVSLDQLLLSLSDEKCDAGTC